MLIKYDDHWIFTESFISDRPRFRLVKPDPARHAFPVLEKASYDRLGNLRWIDAEGADLNYFVRLVAEAIHETKEGR